MKTYSSSFILTDSFAPLVSAYFTQLGSSPSPQQIAGECLHCFLSNHASSIGPTRASDARPSATRRASRNPRASSAIFTSTKPLSISFFTVRVSIMRVSLKASSMGAMDGVTECSGGITPERVQARGPRGSGRLLFRAGLFSRERHWLLCSGDRPETAFAMLLRQPRYASFGASCLCLYLDPGLPQTAPTTGSRCGAGIISLYSLS
jgi:hypothetical protein